jgi:hypothetical protein
MFDVRGRGAGGEAAVPAAADQPSPGLPTLCREVEALVGLDWADLDGHELADAVASAGRVWRVAEAAVAQGMAALSRAGSIDGVPGLPAASWWAHQRLGHGGQGAWLVRAGELMERFPVLGAAVRQGELWIEHLRVLEEIHDDEVLARLTELDQELCTLAGRVSLTSWRREIRRRVEVIHVELTSRGTRGDGDTDGDGPAGDGPAGDGPDGDGPAGDGPADGRPGAGGPVTGDVDPDRGASSEPTDRPVDSHDAPAHRDHGPEGPSLWDFSGSVLDDGWLALRTTAEGVLLVRGELRGPDAEVVRQLIAGELSRQRRAAWQEHDALGVRMPTAGQLRARALVRLLRGAPAGGSGASAAPRTEAVVVIEADDLVAEQVRGLDGEPISAESAAALCCDAHLQALIVDQRGQPLWLGRSTRLASSAQRRALAVRDGGCVFPGCEVPPEWCDAHHEPGWTQGGRTDLHHMVLLCRRHHGAAHSRHWQLRPVEGDLSPPRGRAPLQAESQHLESQHFEWLDRHTGAVTPAQQRALRSPPSDGEPTGARSSPERRCA